MKNLPFCLALVFTASLLSWPTEAAAQAPNDADPPPSVADCPCRDNDAAAHIAVGPSVVDDAEDIVTSVEPSEDDVAPVETSLHLGETTSAPHPSHARPEVSQLPSSLPPVPAAPHGVSLGYAPDPLQAPTPPPSDSVLNGVLGGLFLGTMLGAGTGALSGWALSDGRTGEVGEAIFTLSTLVGTGVGALIGALVGYAIDAAM